MLNGLLLKSFLRVNTSEELIKDFSDIYDETPDMHMLSFTVLAQIKIKISVPMTMHNW